MLKKLHPTQVPARYVFRDPDTGTLFEASTIHKLMQRIIMYRVQNGLPLIDELQMVIENYLCNLPENAGKCVSIGKLKRGWLATIRGGIVLFKNYMFQNFVSQEVAEERAQQCVSCKYNVFPDDKDRIGFDVWADSVAVNMVGDREVSQHDDLGSCEVCTCVLRGKVWHKGKLAGHTKEQLKKFEEVGCWQLKE